MPDKETNTELRVLAFQKKKKLTNTVGIANAFNGFYVDFVA